LEKFTAKTICCPNCNNKQFEHENVIDNGLYIVCNGCRLKIDYRLWIKLDKLKGVEK